MKINVMQGVVWETEATVQSEEAMSWLRNDVLTRMGTEIGEFDKTEPESDSNHRPIRWVIDMTVCIVTIVREYVKPNSSSWAMKKDTITVTPKTE